MSQTTAPKPCFICGQESTIEDKQNRSFCGTSHLEHQGYLDKVEEERKKRDEAEQVEILKKNLEEEKSSAS